MGKVIKIREIGDPILNNICKKVDIKNIDENIIDIISDLKETLAFSDGLGIAAPQIGVDKRIILLCAKKEDIKYNDAEEVPLTVMINPTWKKLSDESDLQYEGCMSIPEIRGKVLRYKNINVTYYDEFGKKIRKNISGFFARLVQHECDHLDGICFIEKVNGKDGFATVDMIKKFDLKNK